MCKTEVADSAFADCRRLSDIEYGQWDFSDTEDIYISDAPMRKMRRPFFRIKVILKKEPRLESEIVMEKAKRLYEYIAEHSDLQKEIRLPERSSSTVVWTLQYRQVLRFLHLWMVLLQQPPMMLLTGIMW